MAARAVLVFSVVLWLAGCTMIPKYHRPDMPVPNKWPGGEAYQGVKVGEKVNGQLKWREFFTDERLRKIIEIALINNRDLRLAALNVERARAMYGVQRAELFPAVDAIGSVNIERVPGDLSSSGESVTQEQYSLGVGITSWEIDFFGRIRSLEKKALEEYLATDEARRSAQISLISEVARAYFTLAADRENLRLAQNTLKTQREIYELIRQQYKVGLATELDLRRVQTQVDRARVDVARYTQLVAQDKNALNLLAGTTVPEDLLPPDLTSVIPPKEVSPGLPSDVLLSRPDIMAAEHRLKAAYAYIGAARAAFFPRISLTTTVGTASDELLGLFGSGSGTWNFLPQFVMPIFDARVWAAHRVSKVERKIALAQYEKAIQTAFREVADALAVKGTVDKQISAQESLVTATKKTYDLSLERYKRGIDDYLGVLDAQRSLYASQQGLISLRLAKIANQVRLYAVLGGGVE